MKSYRLFLIALCILSLASCRQDGPEEAGSEENTPEETRVPAPINGIAKLTFDEVCDSTSAYGKPWTWTNEYGNWDICAFMDPRSVSTGFQLNASKSGKDRTSYIGIPEHDHPVIGITLSFLDPYGGNILVCSEAGSSEPSGIISTTPCKGLPGTYIDLVDYDFHKLWIRTDNVVNISAVIVEYSDSPSGSDPFIKEKEDGVYDVSSESATSVLHTVGDGDQTIFTYGDNGFGWSLLSDSKGFGIMLCTSVTDAFKNQDITLSVKTIGLNNPFRGVIQGERTVKVCRKNSSRIWLKDEKAGRGFIIPFTNTDEDK